ncbi:response regulator transcription factor [Polaribacter dokdonensis]|uniref:Two component transcriptional regulator, LuxR family n=1 Tax=Polaribacter dokdonensis DSW-5 TaxID=1300348 RepID=A0A0N0CF20_9FLAO|nr:response regulator transcription factor [Polaribacter dokdonensis]KOY51234.1 Two-component system response regulator, LuxR family [Polaribacter dokdonensis DSW-5]SEE15864.1 two component transcriptional regulator, LuxR family [Polaribacter dokdonensis DSW-5]
MSKFSVVIVDDHTLLSQAIQTMVNTFEDFTVMYTCKNGQELVDRFSENGNKPNIVLMDINMPVMNGIEATAWISENCPSVNVMALSIEDDDKTVLKMIKAGAVGYLLKDTEKSVLEKALREIVENGFYHTKNVTNLLMKSVSGVIKDDVVLKPREIEFLRHACTELTYKEVADRMCLSPKTIDGYREALFAKLNVRNRVGLVIYAVRNKIYTV